MTIFESLKAYFTKDEKHTPENYCPNCWGKQEYGGEFYDAVKNEGIDVNNMDQHKGWIQEYAEKNLVGIKLKKNPEGYVCPNCKLSYHQR